MGYLYQRGKVWYVQFTVEGKTKNLSLKTENKKTAEKKRRELLQPALTLNSTEQVISHVAEARKLFNKKSHLKPLQEKHTKRRIAIIDADLLDTSRYHRFPNLASMKISNWHKQKGDTTKLILNWEEVDCLNEKQGLFGTESYDKVYISKVFTDTTLPPHLTLESLQAIPHVEIGGTGFFFDLAPALPHDVEHIMPDYHLYDAWVKNQRKDGVKEAYLKYYTEFSIGFSTRGCIRQCSFCINRNSTKVTLHSPIKEFLDESRPYITLCDDNILASPDWNKIYEELMNTGKPFEFKQGIDFRLLTHTKAACIKDANYYGDYIFAFDDVEDKDLIVKNLERYWKRGNKKSNKTKFYVLVGFDRNNLYNDDFWIQDIKDAFERIKILFDHKCLPYIMRHENCCKNPKYAWFYTALSAWCNQVHIVEFTSFKEVYRQRCHKKTPVYAELIKKHKWFRDGTELMFNPKKFNPDFQLKTDALNDSLETMP